MRSYSRAAIAGGVMVSACGTGLGLFFTWYGMFGLEEPWAMRWDWGAIFPCTVLTGISAAGLVLLARRPAQHPDE